VRLKLVESTDMKEIRVVILEFNCTVSELAVKLGTTRVQIYRLIHDGKLSGVTISGVFYPDFSDIKYIKSLLRHDKQGLWSRNYRPGKSSRNRDENDDTFQREWEESMK